MKQQGFVKVAIGEITMHAALFYLLVGNP